MTSLFFLWFHQLGIALMNMLIPPIIVSILMVKYVDIERIKETYFGKYIGRTMTTGMEDIRLLGFIIMVLGACFNIIWFIGYGLSVILFGWLRGVITKKLCR